MKKTAPAEPLLHRTRAAFHARLLTGVLGIDSKGMPSNADSSNPLSVKLAMSIALQLKSGISARLKAQTSGSKFEAITAQFVEESFLPLQHLRPGEWEIKKVGNRSRSAISGFEQYAHLAALDLAAKSNPELAAVLGNDYTITPDVILIRHLEKDAAINSPNPIVDLTVARRTALRAINGGNPLLHASISTKWTIRSDRSQNSRSEALNLMRNRKGHLPHIVVVTGEPLPSRLASIALGTGDIDCVYHFALPELQRAVEESGESSAADMLAIMVNGKRLKDISDLPLDLAV